MFKVININIFYWLILWLIYYCFPSFLFDKQLLESSGKLQLLDKLMVKLKEQGHSDENKLNVAFYNEEQDHSPSHLKFFLLIFAKDKAQAQAQEGQSPQKLKDHPMKGKAKF